MSTADSGFSNEGKSYIRIPFAPGSPVYETLLQAVRHAAKMTGAGDYKVAMILTHFWDAVVYSVARGETVRIPGIGIFGPWLTEKRGQRPVASPRFVPARPFRVHVRNLCDPKYTRNHTLNVFRRSHHPSSKRDRVFSDPTSVMLKLRDSFRSQMGD